MRYFWVELVESVFKLVLSEISYFPCSMTRCLGDSADTDAHTKISIQIKIDKGVTNACEP